MVYIKQPLLKDGLRLKPAGVIRTDLASASSEWVFLFGGKSCLISFSGDMEGFFCFSLIGRNIVQRGVKVIIIVPSYEICIPGSGMFKGGKERRISEGVFEGFMP